MNKAVIFTVCNRPDYFSKSLSSWKNVAVKEDYSFFFKMEPDPSREKMIRRIGDFYTSTKVAGEVIENNQKMGVLVNPWSAFDTMFGEHNMDFVILAEDDIEVSDDILHFFNDLAEKHKDDKEIMAICASSYEFWKDSNDTSGYSRREAFCPLIWGTWKDRWENYLRDTWDKDYSTGKGSHGGWDWNIYLRVLPQNNMKCIYPKVSRSKHIGIQGVHMREKDYENSVAISFNSHNNYVEYKEKPLNSILLIVPTRNRPDAVQEFYDEFIKTSHHSDLIFGIDSDDTSTYPELENARYEINERMGMNGTLNYLANKYADDYEYICFMGDDHRIRTNDWDLSLSRSIGKLGVAYGNDLIQGSALPTAVMMSSNIIKTLGFMAPPAQKHMYLDNFWLDLGNKLGAIHYRDDIIIEHQHFSVTGEQMDQTYQETNNAKVYSADEVAYNEYKSTQLDLDVEKILKCVND